MKITKEIFKENALIGIGTGLVVTGLCYFINKKCINDINELNESNVECLEDKLKEKQKELDELDFRIVDVQIEE